MPVTPARLAQHHAELGDAFHDVVAPAAFPQTILRFRNRPWAERIGLGDLTDETWIAHPYFAGPDPCTLLIDEVEALWAPIAEGDDWSALHAKLAAIDRMADACGTRVVPPVTA